MIGYRFIPNNKEESNIYYYHPDHLGSSSYITDKEGKIIQHTEYMAFGEILFDEHAVSNKQPYLFNGKELDSETGLYYYGARYYDPRTSIFLNVDPLVEKTMTPYAYTYNNPINLIDPTGMEAEHCPSCPKAQYEDQRVKIGGNTYAATHSVDNTTLEWIQETSIKEVTILSPKAQINRREAQRHANIDRARQRYYNAVANCKACQELKSFERFMFLYVPMTIATGGAGGFSLSGQMATRAIGGRILTDISIQTLANATTNGGNFTEAIGDINFTQSILAGAGMNYVGNSLISTSTKISISNRQSIFTGTVSHQSFLIGSGLSILGGATASGISNSIIFRNFTIGSYMQTTSIFGQTAGSAVGNMIINIPDYGTSVIQNKLSPQ